MIFPKLLENFTKCLILKILKKRKKRKTMPLFELLALFLGYLFSYLYILFGVVWLGSKGVATDNCLIS
jgi:hypothetical protein